MVRNLGMKAKPEIGLGFQGGENAELASSGNSFLQIGINSSISLFMLA